MQIKAIKNEGYEDLWGWFGLSYASFAVMPRILMHAMPDDWQKKMAKLLREFDREFENFDICSGYTVQLKNSDGKFIKSPQWLLNYRRPDEYEINKCRREKKDAD